MHNSSHRHPRAGKHTCCTPLTYNQIHTLMNATANEPALHDLHALATLMRGPGIRPFEVAAVRWSDIDFGERVMTIRMPKRGTARSAYLDDASVAVLQARRERDGDTAFVLGSTPRSVIRRASSQFRRLASKLPRCGFAILLDRMKTHTQGEPTPLLPRMDHLFISTTKQHYR